MSQLKNSVDSAKYLVVVGAGTQGQMIQNVIAQFDLGYEFWGYLDDKFQEIHKEEYYTAPIDAYKEFTDKENFYFMIAIGDPDNKKEVKELLDLPDEKYATIVHPFAYVDPSATLGVDVYISANATLMHKVKIGNHSFVLASATMEYETVIDEFVLVAANTTMSGKAHVKSRVFVGAGSVIMQERTVGENTIVGANATVVHDVPDNSIAIGTPARFKHKADDKSAVHKVIHKK